MSFASRNPFSFVDQGAGYNIQTLVWREGV